MDYHHPCLGGASGTEELRAEKVRYRRQFRPDKYDGGGAKVRHGPKYEGIGELPGLFKLGV